MTARFRFDRRWSFDVPPSDLWAAVTRTEDFTHWWSWLRTFDVDALVEGATARCVVQAPIPYRLRFTVHVRTLVPCELIDAVVAGDLAGDARLEVARDGKTGSSARLEWDVELRDPVLRVAARVARPVMEWGHDWVVATGVRQFRQRGLRRTNR